MSDEALSAAIDRMVITGETLMKLITHVTLSNLHVSRAVTYLIADDKEGAIASNTAAGREMDLLLDLLDDHAAKIASR